MMTRMKGLANRKATALGHWVWVAVLGATVASGSAHAGDLRVDGELGYETGIFGAPRYALLGTTIARDLPNGVEVAAGVRVAAGGTLPSPAIAGFGRAGLVARFRTYCPGLGIEVEATTATDATPAENDPPGSMQRQLVKENHRNVLRLSVVASPARWQWQHLLLGAAAFRMGTPLSNQVGDRVYITLWLLTVGYSP